MQIEHVIIIILSVWSANLAWQRHKTVIKGWFQYQKDRLPRRWLPKTPEDCPQCQQGVTIEHPQINWDVQPYAKRKSKRGRKKSIPTEGYACPNPRCCYFGITRQAIHAVVSHGKRGKQNNIQYFKCQACQKTFSSRRGSVLYYLKTNADRVEFSLWFLAEGIDRSVLVRYSGHVDATLTRWLRRAGRQGLNLHNTYFQQLNMAIIQMDELYAKVRNTQKSAWVWLAIEPVSKALPSLHVGGRKTLDAYALVHDLKYALTRLTVGERRRLYAALRQNGYRSIIQTAFIERVNLTIRQSVSFLTRRTWSTARSEEHLGLHLEWWRCYYHFMRPHKSLAKPMPGFRWKHSPKTPAMALELTDRVWTVRDFIYLPLVAPPAMTSHSP